MQKYQHMQGFAQYLSSSLDKAENINYLFSLLTEFKRTSSVLSDLVEETKQMYTTVQQSCKDLAELEDWINTYSLTLETDVCISFLVADYTFIQQTFH